MPPGRPIASSGARPPLSRFDAPNGEYRIGYFGKTPEIAFAEALVRGAAPPLVSRSVVETRLLSGARLSRELRLVSLHGPGLVALGLGAEIVHGHPYDRCRVIALALWGHRDGPDGVQYRSRWDTDGFCVALFDRAAAAVDTVTAPLRLRDPAVARPLLRYYGVGVIP